MKRDRALVAVFVIFMILMMNPSMSSIPAAIGIEHQEGVFSIAGDGDESSESLTSFSETSADDTLTVVDGDNLDTFRDVTDYSYSDDCTDAARWYSDDDWDNFESSGGQLYMNFTGIDMNNEVDRKNDNIDITPFTPSGFKIWMRFKWNSTDATPVLVLGVWNKTSHADQDYWTLSGYDENVWNTITGDFADLTVATEIVILASSISETKFIEAWFEYIVIDAPTRVEDSSSVYAESFADVSDWTHGSGYCDMSTDGDMATITSNGVSGRNVLSPSFTPIPSAGAYIEMSVIQGTAGDFLIAIYDGTVWRTLWSGNGYKPNWGTTKTYIESAQGWDGSTVERVRISVYTATQTVFFDNLRIGKSTEMGWQHDGSTTAGVSDLVDCTVTSDGDKLNITGTLNAGSGNYFDLYMDTTTTQAYIEEDYYQFLEISISAVTTISSSSLVGLARLYGSDGNTYVPEDATWFNSAGIIRFNVVAGDSGNPNYIKFIVFRLNSYTIDYVKLYSIANYTVTQSGAGTDDYLYVDSGVLYSSIDDGYIELNHDPALSVSDTYSVYNLTTSGTTPEFSQYVSEWSAYSDETRGATTSGTVTDIKLKFDAIESISAIKFIEDGTAPDADIVVSPNPPDDDEQVTLSSIIFDDVEVWKVWYNAISYPTGFSDVDYEAAEGQENYWSYSFSSLIAGDYCFKVIANDGANNNTITQSNRDYATVRFTVREAVIEIITYTLFGASSDFTYMQYSFWISHDCTFIIEEWSDTWAKNETHTGSVSRGDRNIAWDKIGVNDVNANYTITFTSGSLTKVIDGGYITAYKALQVTEIDFVNLEQSDSWTTNLTINFYTNKEVDWTVYDRDADDAVLHSGTTTEGDGFITWVQNTARGAHQFAVKWTDGVSDQWYNNSYWVFDRNIDDLPGGADPGKDQRRTIEFWATLGGIAGIIGIMVIGLSHYNMDEKIKNLPNYGTQG